MSDLFSSFWNGFTSVPITIYNAFTLVLDFVKLVPRIFTKVVNFIPYPLNVITIAFIPIVVLCMTFKVIKE